jgi:hypothetical protein
VNHALHFHLSPSDMGALTPRQFDAMNEALREMDRQAKQR